MVYCKACVTYYFSVFCWNLYNLFHFSRSIVWEQTWVKNIYNDHLLLFIMFLFLFKVSKRHRDIIRNIFFNIRADKCSIQKFELHYPSESRKDSWIFAILLLLCLPMVATGMMQTKFDMIWKWNVVTVTTFSLIWAISAWWKPVTTYTVEVFLFLQLILPYTHISFCQFANIMSNLQTLTVLKFQLLLFWLHYV